VMDGSHLANGEQPAPGLSPQRRSP
jgi:hypothetical protein